MSSDPSICSDCGNIRTSREECESCKSAATKSSLEELRKVMTPTQTFSKLDILKGAEEIQDAKLAQQPESSIPPAKEQINPTSPTSSPEQTGSSIHQSDTSRSTNEQIANENSAPRKGFLSLIMSWFGFNQ